MIETAEHDGLRGEQAVERRHSLKQWRRWSLLVLAAAAAVVLLRSTLFRPRPIEVEVVPITQGVVEDAVTNSQAGTVKSRRRARLGAERAGRVVRISHREGVAVRSGDVVVELDASTTRKRLDVARRDLDVQRAALASARAAFRLAEAEIERTRRLREQGLVSQEAMDQVKSRYDRVQADLDAAESGLERAEASVRLAQDDLDHMRVTAPFDGVVSQRLVEMGESVVPGQPVLEIVAPDDLYVSAAIDEMDIGRLLEGLPARVTLDPYRGQVWNGRVTRIFPAVDDRLAQNRTLEVEVDLEPDSTLPTPKPGTSADVVIVIDQRDDVLRVPTFAVIEGQRVLVVERGRAVSRNVTLGLRNWNWTEVREGLAPGEQVITSLDKQGVRAGAAVKPRAREDPQSSIVRTPGHGP
jgi:HlyD family secretion protein